MSTARGPKGNRPGFWPKSIPSEIQHEIKTINKFTTKTGREASITYCQKPGRDHIFVSNSAEGSYGGAPDPDCDLRYGESVRIGDTHTHPTDRDTLGITPSQPDIYSTLVDSRMYKQRQISCVTSPETPLTECYQPKMMPTPGQLYNYEKALDNSVTGVPGFYMDNFHKDFEVGFFNPDNGQRVKKPPAKQIVKAALGNSIKDLRTDVSDLERAGFCEYIASFTEPSKAVVDECKATLRKRSLLGLIDY
jgi:hypothetical protein